MSAERFNYTFQTGTDMDQVEDVLILATMATEGLHGRSGIQLDASFSCDHKSRLATVDVGTDVGRTIARIFTALLSTTIGEFAFKIERIAKEKCTC